MRLPGLRTLVQSGRWLWSRFAPGGIILGYHRVAEADASAHGMCVSPAHFAEHLDVIRRHGHPVSLLELVDGLDDGSLPPRAVALTFDDGYADVLERAWPLLERHAIPATVFVITGCLGQTFWWDELAHAVNCAKPSAGRLSLRVGGVTVMWLPDDSRDGRGKHLRDRARLVSELHRRLLPLALDDRRRILARVREWAGDPPGTPETGRSLTAAEVQQLAGGLVDIGAHTVSHPLLANQPIALQCAEIRDGKRALEALLGRPVTAFSFPNGSASPTTRALVEEAGFRYACGSQPDVARRNSHRHHLPRFWVPDCDGDAFARWLRPWLRA